MFRSLQVRNYRLFATNQLIKLIGTWMMVIAQDWLVLHLTNDSATALGIVMALQFVPAALLTLPGGRLADRYDKRKILLFANGLWSGLAIIFAILVASGGAVLWHVYLFALLMGIAQAIETPVRQAFVSELVGTPLLPNALSLSAAAFNTARIVGPAIAGVGIALLGMGPIFVISAVVSACTLIGLVRLRPDELYRADLRTGDDRVDARILDGITYVWRRPDLRLPLILMGVIGFAGFNFQLTLAALARTVFNTGAAAFGLFTTALAIGALGGALAGTLRKGRPSVYLLLGAAIAFSAFEIIVGIATSYWVVVGLLVITGFFMVLFAQASNQRVQLGTDAAFRGRVMSLYVLVFLGTAPISAPVIGWVAEHVGASASIWLGGAVSLAAALVALAWQLRHAGDKLHLQVRPTPRLYVTPAPVPERVLVAAAS
ncbi:MFS family permease [Allocatelliglobosispora scoriae]|uniref:MFS family permease n=1 Tax=Allocatelliglobosispora scoriae TaxID=643052 RepID=A0A841BWR3_9ACTN|nr:MFS transporter [Allocatelliglobosispora scoriae]MBB5871353.1 MFS family permease [Allocatelliglobosispora scoriae]